MNRAETTERRAQRYDAPVLSEVDSLRVVARHDATAERRRHDAGYLNGHREGYAAGAAEVDAAIADHRRNAERLSELCAALDAAIAERQRTDDALLAEVSNAVIEASVRVAELLIGREVTEYDLIVDRLRECLGLRAPDEHVVVRMHPDDLACAAEAFDAGLLRGADDVELAGDPAVARGGCVVDAPSMRIDGQLDLALDRIADALHR
ncbi:MAG: FliH/SctL family protein [Actinomycetota bacterium]